MLYPDVMEKDLTGMEKLRKKAEAKLKKMPATDSLSPKEVSELLHELHVHQEELEMQNQELREMQQRLEMVRDQYTDLFDFAPVGYFILDNKGVINNVNLTGCHLIGLERKGLKGKPFSVFIAKRNGDAGHFYLFLKSIFNSATLNSVELQLKKSNGLEFPVQMEGIIIPDATGNPSLCRLTLRDISQEKRTGLLEQLNEQLRREKETARQYLEMSGVIFLAIDLMGTITMINQKGCELLGYKQIGHKKPGLPSEVSFRSPLGLNWFEKFIPEKERLPVNEVFDRLKDDQPEMEYFENNILCLDGSQRTISWHNSVLRDASGKITGILGAGTDITIRKQEEIKLKKALAAQQESELRFRNIFENANDAITIIDAESFKILNANCKMMTRLGYTGNELFHLKIFDVYDTGTNEVGMNYARELLEKKQLLFEAVQIRKDGVAVPVEVNSCLIEYGGRKAFLSISRDITERRKVEGLLMATLLEGQEKERQRIAGDLHDSIQPLLATIKRKLETLDPKVNAAIPEKAKEYKSVTLLLDKTLKEIRAIAHNLVPPALKDFGLVATLRDLCETMDQPGKLKVNFFSDGMAEKNDSENKMNFHVATGLYRIAQELLYNAVKHSKAKSITLQLVRHDKSCVLMIEDNGTGFKEPFKKKGLGMGSISARVKMMDGTLDIDSLEGRGTIITVEVPVPEFKN